RAGPAAAVAVLGMLAMALVLHANAVADNALATDRVSQGWLGLRGPSGPVNDLGNLTWLQLVPEPLQGPLALAPMLGWHAYGRANWLPFLWFGAFGVVLMIAARPDNYYWTLVMLPLY